MANKNTTQEDIQKLLKLNPLAEAQLTAIQNARVVEELEKELEELKKD